MAKIKTIFENQDILVIDKPPQMVTYPSLGNEEGTVLDVFRDKINIKEGVRGGIVHRLDKDTSGLLILARNKKSEEALKKIIKERKIEKEYITLVWGRITPRKGIIEIPIRRSEKNRKIMRAAHEGREALTKYEVIKYFKNMTLLKVGIITGRTHQIRVHFSAIGYPIVGDKTYGKRESKILERQFLHAHTLNFNLFGNNYEFVSKLPHDLDNFIKNLS